MSTRKPGLLKWPGGKERELAVLKDYFPQEVHNYYEPFVGGGSVYLNTQAEHYYINDLYDELYNFYNLCLSDSGIFKERLESINGLWKDVSNFFDDNSAKFNGFYNERHDDDVDVETFSKEITTSFIDQHLSVKHAYLMNIPVDFNKIIERTFYKKIKRIVKHESGKGHLSEEDLGKNFKSALKSAVYTYIRSVYNFFRLTPPVDESSKALHIACFYFIRNYCYSSMFRFNKAGEFNVPYGGLSYNENYLDKKIAYIYKPENVARYAMSEVSNLDFEEFIKKQSFNENDFIFLDPPYDTEFSEYAQNVFDKSDQERLANTLLNTKAKWLLVTKYTDFIESLYDKPGINIERFAKKYLVSFKNRNDQDAHHLVIRNYI
jgi:DNA adenine methylase